MLGFAGGPFSLSTELRAARGTWLGGRLHVCSELNQSKLNHFHGSYEADVEEPLCTLQNLFFFCHIHKERF